MLNQSILVGRIVKEPEIKEAENGSKMTHLTLAVQDFLKILMVSMIVILFHVYYGVG